MYLDWFSGRRNHLQSTDPLRLLFLVISRIRWNEKRSWLWISKLRLLLHKFLFRNLYRSENVDSYYDSLYIYFSYTQHIYLFWQCYHMPCTHISSNAYRYEPRSHDSTLSLFPSLCPHTSPAAFVPFSHHQELIGE
jgi:hypothetical protein